MALAPIEPFDIDPKPLAGERFALRGAFASLARRDVAAAVLRCGGVIDTQAPTVVLVGEDATAAQRHEAAEEAERLGAACWSETRLWARLGLLDLDEAEASPGVRRLYTPGTLAELTGAPVTAIRRWDRRGWLRAACRVHRLAYFRLDEVRVARLLAGLLVAGRTLAEIDSEVETVLRRGGGKSLAETTVAIASGRLLVRDGGTMTDPLGQRLLGFEGSHVADPGDEVSVLPIAAPEQPRPATSPREAAWAHAQAGDFHAAVEAWRLVLLECEPDADDHFVLAEWLRALGEPHAARERLYAALELDADHAEARLTLGCVLRDLGELGLAAAAFHGVVDQHEGFADAHYHLAQTLEQLGETAEADEHWHRLEELAPRGPGGGGFPSITEPASD